MSNSISFYLQGSYVLSNFSAHAVEFNGSVYPTAEHAYQAQKFKDPEIKLAILSAKSPMDAKTLANARFAKKKSLNWDEKKLDIMKQILSAKLHQHDEVRNFLVSTANSTIEESSPTDMFWGVGPDRGGKNMLGKIWMELRENAAN